MVVLAPIVLSIFLAFLAIVFGSVAENLGTLLIFLTPVIAFIFSSFLLVGVTEIALSDKEGSKLSYENFLKRDLQRLILR